MERMLTFVLRSNYYTYLYCSSSLKTYITFGGYLTLIFQKEGLLQVIKLQEKKKVPLPKPQNKTKSKPKQTEARSKTPTNRKDVLGHKSPPYAPWARKEEDRKLES